ncbi:hypothetical protein ACHAQA_007264 [Verticillium albo-atrum]
MPIELRPVQASDVDILKRCAAVEAAAFATSHVKPIVYPGPFPPDGDARRANELVEALSSDQDVRLVVAVDTELEGADAVIAWAKWAVYPEGMPAPKKRTFGPGMNVEAATLMYGGIDGLMKSQQGLKCLYLNILVTDPKHQGRGAGRLLVGWGNTEADRLGLAGFLESSEAGHALYAKCGYEDVEPCVVSLAQFGHDRLYKAWGMVRQPVA